MPTEWIHHPWDAPLTVLRASGVELGQNYPKPIIDIDLAREQLTQAIFKMWENEAAAKASSSSQDKHEVVDERTENLAIPKVFLKGKAPTSSNDQKVPTLQNPQQSDPPNRKKRLQCMEELEQKQDNYSRKLSKDAGVSSIVIDQEVCSTGESSCSKRQSSSTFSFSVPQECSSSSNTKWSGQEQIDMEQSCSNKDGESI